MSASEFQISDFTVISSWEAFTASIANYFKYQEGNQGNNESTIEYKGVLLSLTSISKVDKIAILSELPHFSVTGKVEGGYLARAFDLDEYFIVRCGEESVNIISLSTARLLLSSFLINDSSKTIFIEYGEGNVLGIGPKGRYSLITNQTDEVTPSVVFRHLIDKYYGNVTDKSTLKVSFCMTLSTTINGAEHLSSQDHPLNLPWGSKYSLVNSLEVQAIFPKVNSELATIGILPEALNQAPILMLSVKHWRNDDDIETRLCDIINGLLTLVRSSQQPQMTVDDPLHNKTKMYNLLGRTPKTFIDWSTHMRYIFQSEEKDSFIKRIAFCMLISLLEKDTISKRSLTNSFSSFWSELISILRQYWKGLESLPLNERSVNSTSTVLEHKLVLLDECIKREQSYCLIPEVPGRNFTSQSITDPLDAIAAFNSQESKERTQNQLEQLKSKGSAIVNAIIGKGESLKNSSKQVNDSREALNSPKVNFKSYDKEEFFDALEEIPTVESMEVEELVMSLKQLNTNNNDEKPEHDGRRIGGRREELKGMKLLNSDDSMWIPYTQEAAIFDEDDYESVSRKQCSQLASDMQAFKAANPNAEFADFVRWHSPKDWTIEKGLSNRMAHSGNLWTELWKACHPQPVAEQKLLFDHRKEAERILFWFEDVLVVDLLTFLLPLALCIISEQLSCLGRKFGGEFSINVPHSIDEESILTFKSQVSTAEVTISLSSQLFDIIPKDLDFITLVKGDPIIIAQEGHRQSISQLFIEPQSIERELVIDFGQSYGTNNLYIRLFDGLLEVATLERW